MEKKKSLYRGRHQMDYEIPFSDKEGSTFKIKEHMRRVKEYRKAKDSEKNEEGS